MDEKTHGGGISADFDEKGVAPHGTEPGRNSSAAEMGGRRASVAVNIIENPLKVGDAKLDARPRKDNNNVLTIFFAP